MYYLFDQLFIVYYLLFGFFLLLYTWIIIPQKSYNIKKFAFTWFIIGPLYMSFFILILWEFSLLSFLWILILPLGSYIFFSFKAVIYYTFYIILYIASILFISYKIDFSDYFYFSRNQVMIIDIIVVINSLFILILLIYYLNKINLAQYKTYNHIRSFSTEISKDDMNKYTALFFKIIKYMEEKEPFKKYDFTISKLAFALNSNHSYISKAIKLNGYLNFNTFLNSYRIKYVKNQLDLKKHGQYTLRYIYSEAGFTHQSTFNRVFKEVEGITPTQYILSLEEQPKFS